MNIITWFFLGMTVLACAAIPLYLKWQQKADSGNNFKNTSFKPTKNKKADLKSLWEIQEVKNGVIILAGGYRYRMVIRLASADFYLMSHPEQTQIEDSLASALLGLTFPVQFLTVSEAVDTRQAVHEVKEKLDLLSETIKDYAENYASYLESLGGGKMAANTTAYMILPYDTDQGFEHALSELEFRAMSLAGALQSAKIRSEILSTPAIVDLLHHLLNRNRNWRPSEADAAGAMELYHVPERRTLNDVMEEFTEPKTQKAS